MSHVRHQCLQASSVAEEVLKTEYDSVRLLYNSFKSAISFKPTVCTILSPETLEKSDTVADKFDQYELEGPGRAELLQDLAEFQLASMMYYAMNEACTSEHASRMQVCAGICFCADMLECFLHMPC
jgi:F-type H+-transporting ATPase subunit gamma